MTRTERIQMILSDYYGEAKADAVARIMAVFAHDDIIARYKGGETVSSIARSLGMSRAGVKYRIRRFSSPDYVQRDWKDIVLEMPGEENALPPRWEETIPEANGVTKTPFPQIVEEIDIHGNISVFIDEIAPPLPLHDLSRVSSNIYRSSLPLGSDSFDWYEGRTWKDGRFYFIYSTDIDKVRNYINKLKDE